LKKYALLSVSDKTGLVEFGRGLSELGYNLLATGNTAKALKNGGLDCTEISEYTNFPEIFSGRVKTLQPQIFGGILMRRDNDSDKKEAEENNVFPIDIVCVNLYPFPKVVNRTDISVDEKIENIDIGGPSLIRAAAKNFKYVSVLTDPAQYDDFLEELSTGEIGNSTAQKLAYDAFAHTSFYDTLIADYFEKEFDTPKSHFRVNYPLSQKLRYGENPHQSAELYGSFHEYFDSIHGKELSYNNIVDLVAAVGAVNDLGGGGCIIVKHTNPCGSAIGESVLDSYEKALSCDPVSAFGGIVAFKDEVDAVTAEKLNEIFLEIVCAPSFSPEALDLLKKKKNRRIVIVKKFPESDNPVIKSVPGGVLIQENDNSTLENAELKLVTEREYSPEELEDLKFAWVICKHTKSNAIVFVKDKKGVGIGAGQMSRVDAARIAAEKAKLNGHDLNGAVAASDAFFPFADGLEEIAKNGIKAVIQPGGSVRDSDVIEAANRLELAMAFTGIRNFKH